MQLSELIAAVRDELQDTATKRWSDSTITRYLNDGQLDLAKISKQLNLWQNSVDAGTTSIILPTDLLIPKAFWFEIGSWRYPLDIKYGFPPESSTVMGDPLEVYLMGSYVYFYPTIRQNGTMYVLGIMRPTPMSATTDTPSITDADDVLILYAVWKCLSSDGDPDAARRGADYSQAKLEWSLLDAQKNPMPDRIERSWWW